MVLDVRDARHGRPASSDGLVRRGRLLERLRAERDVPLLTVIAPAGYGKSTLLAAWLSEDERASAWLTLTERHNDLALLGADIASAFSDAAALEEPVVMVLDDFHTLAATGARATLRHVAERLPEGSQLALAARRAPALQLGALRAQRALLELHAEDLAMDLDEASALVEGVGLELDAAQLELLIARTEGWPAALCLGALSLREEPDVDAGLARFGGDDRVLADYIWDELLGELPQQAVAFLVQTSILRRLDGRVCDAVLGRAGSAGMLEALAQQQVLIAMDRIRESYRCHALLRDALRSELRRRAPQLEADLHRGASVWHAAHGNLDAAVEHAVGAGDAELVGDLLWANMPRYLPRGRNDAVRRWLGAFAPTQIAEHASLAAVAAHSSLLCGEVRLAEHWGLAATGALARASRPPGVASLPAGLALIDAAVGRRGVVPMGRDAARVYELEDADSPWRAVCCLLQGVCEHLSGSPAQAREHLEEGVRRSAVDTPNIEALCLAQLAMMALEDGDRDDGAALVARALEQVERHGLGAYPTSTLIFAVSAAVHARGGHVDEGKRDLARATRLLAVLVDFIPWYEAETRIALARAALQLADVARARALLGEASQLARRVPDATLLRGWLDDAWHDVDTLASTALAGSAALTMAELRILRFLPTHLSFREIGLRLHVSTNTVKTQAHSVYRKLDASSRSEAVARAAKIGLLSS